MFLATVLGTVWATRKIENLAGVKLMLVQQVDHTGALAGEPLVAVDTVEAGRAEKVFVVTGREASLALQEPFVPVDAAIVGIVESVNVDG